MADRLEFATEAEAQACADQIHADLIATDAAYAKSVAEGGTTAWAIPYQLTGTKMWCVNVKPRCLTAVKEADKAKLKPVIKGELVEAPIIKPPKDPLIESTKPK